MFGLKSTLCLVFVAVCFAPSHQKPIGEDDTLKNIAQTLLPNDGKVNNSDVPTMPMAIDSSRTAFYPNSGGLGYYNIGQMQMPIPHYPLGMPHQTYQTPALSNMMFKNEEAGHSDPRTLGLGLGHGLRPSLYSQYQSVPLAPQVYSYPVQSYHVQPYSYEYSSPLVSGLGSHYSSYSSYPYFRDAEEEKPRQFSTLMPSEKYLSPVRPSVQYTSKYLMGKPLENYENFYQPQIIQPMTMSSMSSPFLIRNSMPGEWSQPQGRALTLDDQLQVQIPNNYLLEKLQQYSPSSEVHPSMTRAAEQPKPFDWSQSFINQPVGYKSGGLNQLIPDPYISPEDGVYVEPYVAGEPTHHVQGSRSADFMPMATFPNHEQQLRMAQMQYYHNQMNNAADHIEPINREYLSQRMLLPNYPGQQIPWENQRMFFQNTQGGMGIRSMEEHRQDLLSQVEGITRTVEELIQPNKSDGKVVKNDALKDEKKENVTGGKQGDVSGTPVSGQTRRV